MSAIERTGNLVRCEIPLDMISGSENNPNKMSPREFDLLVDNLMTVGITDPLLLRPTKKITKLPKKDFRGWAIKNDIQFTIVGGHHRYEAAIYLDFKDVPVTIIVDPKFTIEDADIQMLRHNLIHGKIDPEKFMNLYDKYTDKYGDDMIQDMFGFADDAMFQSLIKETEKSLPPEYKEQFKKAAKEIKTIDGLAKVLNTLFTEHGGELEYNYMIIDFGGKESIWIRLHSSAMSNFKKLGKVCKEKQVTMDGVVNGLVDSFLNESNGLDVESLVGKLPHAQPFENDYNAEDELNDHQYSQD